jgi:hypothetical protein
MARRASHATGAASFRYMTGIQDIARASTGCLSIDGFCVHAGSCSRQGRRGRSRRLAPEKCERSELGLGRVQPLP